MRERCLNQWQKLEFRISPQHIVASPQHELSVFNIASLVEQMFASKDLQSICVSHRLVGLRTNVPNQAGKFIAMQPRIIFDRGIIGHIKPASILIATEE